jgi:hypothetical protein
MGMATMKKRERGRTGPEEGTMNNEVIDAR